VISFPLWTALAWVIVAVAVAAALRIALKPPFRRDLAELPALRAWLVAGGLAGAVIALWGLIRFPVVLALAASGSLLAMAVLWYRAREAHGHRRGWPPGSLGIGASLDAIDDREYYLSQAARHGPIFKMSQFGRPVLCVVGLARARQLLQEHRAALAGASLPYNRFTGKGMLRYLPREAHQSEGPLFRSALSAAALADEEQAVRDACRQLLLGFPAAGGDVRPLIRDWTIEALTRAFFGVAPGDPRATMIARTQRALVLERSGGPAWRASIEHGLASATIILRDAAREHLARGDRSSVLGALVADAPASIEDEGRLRNLFLIFRLAVGDLSAALAWVVYHLSMHPAWQARVRAAGRTNGPARGAQPSDLASRVVLETLRLEQSEFLYRRIIRPIAFEGFHIPAGWLLRICIQESHRDPATFPDPAAFNPDRFLGRSYGRAEYATFGLDEHGCMGGALVLFFGRLFVEEMCAHCDWQAIGESPFERGTRHRHHWRPGRDWRIALVPCNAAVPG
jgi:cytochrome P450